MSTYTLVIGNKNYSSWSLRPWLAMKMVGASFQEIIIPLRQPTTADDTARHSPAGKMPVLHDAEITVWESIAILEYLAEGMPEARLWPENREARATARAVSAEMHAGFVALRTHMPMNIRASKPRRGRTPEVQTDIQRILALWEDCRAHFGEGGPFLFGRFSNADAMYAPVSPASTPTAWTCTAPRAPTPTPSWRCRRCWSGSRREGRALVDGRERFGLGWVAQPLFRVKLERW